MEEKIKIISDGKTAKIYINGEKVMCTDIEFHFIGHVGDEPMIKCDAIWYETNENGGIATDETGTSVKTNGIKINC